MASGTINQSEYYKAGDRVTFTDTWLPGFTSTNGDGIMTSVLLPKKVPSGLTLSNHISSNQYRVAGNNYNANSSVVVQIAGDFLYIVAQLSTARSKMVGAIVKINGYVSFS